MSHKLWPSLWIEHVLDDEIHHISKLAKDAIDLIYTLIYSTIDILISLTLLSSCALF